MNGRTAAIAFGLSLSAIGALAQQSALTVATLDGGSVTTKLGYGISVNAGSSLRRQWFVVNDTGCPVRLDGAGINTTYSDRDYSYSQVGTVTALQPIAAFEVRFVLFDIWGEHLKTLSGIELRDLQPQAVLKLSETGSWRAWESEVTRYFTAVAFVARVRTQDGQAWAANTEAILMEADVARLKPTQDALIPTKPKE